MPTHLLFLVWSKPWMHWETNFHPHLWINPSWHGQKRSHYREWQVGRLFMRIRCVLSLSLGSQYQLNTVSKVRSVLEIALRPATHVSLMSHNEKKSIDTICLTSGDTCRQLHASCMGCCGEMLPLLQRLPNSSWTKQQTLSLRSVQSPRGLSIVSCNPRF